MKIKYFIFVCLTIVSSITLISCSEDTIVPEVSVAEETVDYFTEAMDFPSTGGTKILNFTSNVKWSLTISETQSSVKWCTVSQSEGSAGTYNVSVTVGENAGYDDRNVVLVLSAGELKKNIIVNQKQKNAIALTTDRFEVGSDGGTIDIEVEANVDYSVEIPEAYRGWISQSSKTRAMSMKTLSFNIAENKGYGKREGEIIFKYDDITEVFKVYQRGGAVPPSGVQAVDLGLPSGIKWANMNIGAESPEDYGDYFAWGETTGYKDGKKDFSEDTYKYYLKTTAPDKDSFDITQTGYTKYVTKSCASNYGYEVFYDEKTVLDPEDDAATANWGGSWRMPTGDELYELWRWCTLEWKEQNGVKGYKVTGPNGNFLFLPAAGYCYSSALCDVGSSGCYWSSSLNLNNSCNACYLYFCLSFVDLYYSNRYGGLTVRAVCP